MFMLLHQRNNTQRDRSRIGGALGTKTSHFGDQKMVP